MRTICLTGGIASGKSLAAAVFENLGARVVRADDLARELMTAPDLRDALTQALGTSYYTADGELDRAALAERLFSDSEARQAVNALVHPRVYEAINRQAASAGPTYACFVVETALAVETGYADRFEIVIVVTAPRDERVRRLIDQTGLTAAQAETRLAAQLPQSVLVERADYVIDNAGTIAELEDRAAELYREVCAHG